MTFFFFFLSFLLEDEDAAGIAKFLFPVLNVGFRKLT
jgi:hypothetical protein